jgi:galactokinase
MMGGGFGGCTINIVKEDAVEELIYDVREAYRERTGFNLAAYVASIEDGACIAETATSLYHE